MTKRQTYDELVISRFDEWAHSHPYGNRPMFHTLDGEEVTPLQLAQEVAKRTPLGVEHIEGLEKVAELSGETLEQVLDDMVVSVKQLRVEHRESEVGQEA